jgi:hypothetical protein
MDTQDPFAVVMCFEPFPKVNNGLFDRSIRCIDIKVELEPGSQLGFPVAESVVLIQIHAILNDPTKAFVCYILFF